MQQVFFIHCFTLHPLCPPNMQYKDNSSCRKKYSFLDKKISIYGNSRSFLWNREHVYSPLTRTCYQELYTRHLMIFYAAVIFSVIVQKSRDVFTVLLWSLSLSAIVLISYYKIYNSFYFRAMISCYRIGHI